MVVIAAVGSEAERNSEGGRSITDHHITNVERTLQYDNVSYSQRTNPTPQDQRHLPPPPPPLPTAHFINDTSPTCHWAPEPAGHGRHMDSSLAHCAVQLANGTHGLAAPRTYRTKTRKGEVIH